MVAATAGGDDTLLRPPTSNASFANPQRSYAAYLPLQTYHLPRAGGKHYQQQYADMYFARLAQLKPAVESVAVEAYAGYTIAGDVARRVDRVLDVRQGELVWVVGTVYMELPLKPNVLDDIGKEHWIAAPPPREKYVTDDRGTGVQIMLEDESGRLRLTGAFLRAMLLVTGATVAALGTENKDGDFEVLDLRVPDLPRQPPRWEDEDSLSAMRPSKKRRLDAPHGPGQVAVVSGLSMSGDAGDTLNLDLLQEWLLGEAGSLDGQQATTSIARLVIAGDSLEHGAPVPSREDVAATKKSGKKTYGYDASAYNPGPAERLDTWVASLLPSIPVTLIPGATDPTSTSLPQQPIHLAMFPHSRTYSDLSPDSGPNWFDSTTNPVEFSLSGWRFLGTGGQPVDDACRYISGDERLDMMEAMLRWRLTAPTAPDTLFCFPFQDGDKFVLKDCPHVFFVGNQPRFETRIIDGPQGQKVRLVAVPKFKDTGEVVLLDLETLAVEVVKIELFNG